MRILDRLYGWYGKRVVQGVLGLIVVLIIIGIVVASTRNNAGTEVEEAQKPVVEVRSVSELQSQSSFTVVGTVSAVSEARLQTEAGGHITAVNVGLGDRVAAGTVLASLENSAERAQLLQAEGAYESAVVAAEQSGTSLEEARVSVQNAYRDAFSDVDTIIHNIIDDFFTNPTSANTGFRISNGGNALELIEIRHEIEVSHNGLKETIRNNFRGTSEESLLREVEGVVTEVANFTATIAELVSDEDNVNEFTPAERAAHVADLNQARAALDSALSSISQARSTLEQAKLSGSEGRVSEASARLKSALGSLRSAQSSYEKTLVRTPIAGVVNALYLKAGEYTTQGQPAALIANNGSLEVTTALGEEDLENVEVGGSVRINGAATGTITRIAPAVDPLSGKAEVKISVDDSLSLKNGSTVTVAFERTVLVSESGQIVIPLSSVKLLPSGPVAFGVNGEGKLIIHQLELGTVTGESVEIIAGLTSEMEIVRDVRGLNEGDEVNVTQD